MRILLIHNKYKQTGGEDAVFEIEKNILESHNHTVKAFFFDNDSIGTLADRAKLSYRVIFNKKSKRIVDNLISEFQPDIIHVHNFFYVASPSIFFSAKNNNIPVVVTLHNYRLICSGSLLLRNNQPCELCINKIFPTDGIKYRCHRNSKLQTAQLTLTTGLHKIFKTWTDKVDLYITLTDFARRKFIHSSLQLKEEHVVVKPNSVDDVAPARYDEREDYFLFIGRLSNEKGIEVLLKAFENKTTSVEIIGDGPLRETVLDVTTQNSNIKYLGYRDKPFVHEKLRKCKALIVPSICYESLPTAILEAYATGTPVIISDIQNLNEIVTNNVNGMHFKTNDPASLYKCVETFVTNHSQNEFLYLNARKTYLEKYTHEINYENLITIYEYLRMKI